MNSSNGLIHFSEYLTCQCCFHASVFLLLLGNTEEFHNIALELQRLYPGTKMFAVGFSMGANIVLKYLGESRENQSRFLCGLSICQGYDANL